MQTNLYRHFRSFLSTCSAFLVLTGCAQQTVVSELKDSAQKPAFGIRFDPQTVHFEKPLPNGADSGLKIEIVFPFFPAAEAGLQNGDVLVGFQGQAFTRLPERFAVSMNQRLATQKLGEKVRFQVLRMKVKAISQLGSEKEREMSLGDSVPLGELFKKANPGNAVEMTARWSVQSEILEFEIQTRGKRWDYGNQAPLIGAEWPGLRNEAKLSNQITKLVTEPQEKEHFQDLKERLAALAAETDASRLPVVSFLQKNPERVLDFQNLLLEKSRACAGSDVLDRCLVSLAKVVGLQMELTNGSNKKVEFDSSKQVVQFVTQILAQSELLFQKAFRNFTPAEIQMLKEKAFDITEGLMKGLYLHEDDNLERRQRNLRLMPLLQKIQVTELGRSLIPFQGILDHRQDLLTWARTQCQQGRRGIEKLKSSLGLILIGGCGTDDYAAWAGENPILILDLGGDDFYPDVTANIVDLSGKDRYEASNSWTLAAGLFRTRAVIDFSGDDVYQIADGGLAASFAGASLLLDLDGNDIYRAHAYSMGTSIAGVSALIDNQGQDSYHSAIFSQGVGIAGGIGILMDAHGADRYLSKGASPSSYSDPGQFDGWSQGVGVGFRGFVSGGWGFLYDGDGQDLFESGTFSLGGGYYFGLGSLINDGQQNDFYQSARYSQGFSAHYAVGNFLDLGGDDIYQSSSFVGEGMAWDLSLTLFEDRSGQDSYKTCEHCLGVASQNSMAFFLEASGKDRYVGPHLPYAEKRYNDYHGGTSWGLFWDAGHEADQYEKMKNNQLKKEQGFHILVDE
jgi:hypothetical protein